MKRLALLILLAIPAAGLEPYLVKDLETVVHPAGSDPSDPVTFRGAVLFFADDGISGTGLWRSDGTAAGTFPLSSGGELGAAPEPYLATENLYFIVSSSLNLWVSDGTPAGTFRLTEPDVTVEGTSVWIASQGLLYFMGRDLEHGTELWRTDGTPAGTHLVADIRPGPEPSDISEMAEYQGQAWFGADDGQHGGSLWRSDGTAAGTVLAVDPFPASAGHAPPEYVQAVGNRITFFAEPPGMERSLVKQLWGGDGTAGGTSLISSAKALHDHVVWGNRLYFNAESTRGLKLWVSDGTKPGTRPLTRFPGFAGFDLNFGLPREGFGDGRFLFWADDGTHGAEPWITDGTPGGTFLLKDLCPGPCSTSGATWLEFRGRLYFAVQTDVSAFELWATNGTRAGTRLVSGACPRNCLLDLHSPFAAGDRILFVGQDGRNGQELWSTNGKGIVRITDFEEPFLWPEREFHGAVLGGALLFGAEDRQHAAELWWTDGTAAGAGLVEDINQTDFGGSFPSGFLPVGDEVVFSVDSGTMRGQWKSDGTAAGTTRFRSFGPDEPDSGLPIHERFADAGGWLFYFAIEPGTLSFVPWRTDGTAAGTFQLWSGRSLSAPQSMLAMGSTVFFDHQDPEHGSELWASDGTPEGTRLVLDIAPGPAYSEPLYLTAFQGRLYFAARSPDLGYELWRSDGTAAGTVPVADLHPGASGSAPSHLTVHAGRLWFFANDGEHGHELWSSDGTAAGTRLEVELVPGAGSFEAVFMTGLGARLAVSFQGEGFWMTDGTPAGTRKIHERGIDGTRHLVWTAFRDRLYYIVDGYIWVTDGTEAGTGPFVDREGGDFFSPARYATLGDRLVFSATSVSGAFTLWESDGTPEGTFQIEPPVDLLSSTALVRAGDRLFFPAYDVFTGYELWAARP